ncbi:hypothetical protein [Limnobacter sp.]|uniref:hypothetical protein n=1 Tax=Limnobacter sp. TaxID=2003368 RepID=UPI002735ED01|nr:hypothetical protein [Limnobacter sp.]MDP3189208.1 hypothetical protein [Limnobacter sp.]
MSQGKKTATSVATTSDDRSLELMRIAQVASHKFAGQIDELQKAIGMLMTGDLFGWRVLILVHNKRTIRKYEEILGIEVKEFFPEEGPYTHRSIGYSVASKVGNFWKAVSGDIPIDNRREITKEG